MKISNEEVMRQQIKREREKRKSLLLENSILFLPAFLLTPERDFISRKKKKKEQQKKSATDHARKI